MPKLVCLVADLCETRSMPSHIDDHLRPMQMCGGETTGIPLSMQLHGSHSS